jgi:hypothetical protein
MPEHRRKFSPQFKAEAVQTVISTGKPIAQGPGPTAGAPALPPWPRG